MESNAVGSVRYDRWNEDNINMRVEDSPSTLRRMYNRVCVGGSTGLAVKVAGALAALGSIYIVGYLTGFYVHQCGA